MPDVKKTLSLQKQKEPWIKAYQNKNWSLLQQYLQNSLYKDFIKSEDPFLPELVWQAYQDNQHIFVENILQQINPDIRNIEGDTLLFQACEAKNEKWIDWLLAHNADPMIPSTFCNNPMFDKPFISSKTILEYVVKQLDFKFVSLFITHFNSKHYLDKLIWNDPVWEKVAYRALDENNDEMLEILLKNGVNPNARYLTADTLLHAACEQENLDRVSLLLKYNADPTLKGFQGETPLEYATSFKTPDILHSLLRHVDSKNLGSQLIWKKPIWEVEAHRTLRQALDKKNDEMLEILLKNGVNPNAHDSKGNTLLYQILLHQEKSNDQIYLDLVRCLLRYKADSHLPVNNTDTNVLSAYQYAFQYKHIELIKLFLTHQKAVFLNHQDKNGDTLLHKIIAQSDSSIMELVPILLEQGSNPDLANKKGDTPFHIAVQSENLDIAKKVIKEFFLWGADFACKNSNGKTPVDLASSRADYCKQLSKQVEDTQTHFKVKETKAVSTYLRLSRCLSFHKKPEDIIRSICMMLRGFTVRYKNKTLDIPRELTQEILKYYLRTLDASINTPYQKPSSFRIAELVDIMPALSLVTTPNKP